VIDDGMVKPGDCCPECKVGVEQGRAELLEAAQRVAKKPLRLLRDLDFHAEVEGKRGDIVFVEVVSEHHFRGEKLMATDTHSKGNSTRILGITVDTENAKTGERATKPQFPPGFKGSLSSYWQPSSLGCGIAYDTVRPGGSIKFKVEFLEDCAWHVALFGKAVKELP
jgi:hypothetical protein